jgi:putative ABC transport system permease protein
VTLWSLSAKGVLRNKFRTVMTVIGGAIAVITFVMLRTVVHAWNISVEYAARDRLYAQNKTSLLLGLPIKYVDEIAQSVPGIRSATYCDWIGARWAKDASIFFANVACADNAFEVYPEILVDPAALTRWRGDKSGAIVGDLLAKKLGVRVGDTVTLQGSIYPGDWEFTVDGIYTAPQPSPVDRATFFFRWDYKNDRVASWQKNRAGLIFVRVDDPARSAQVGAAIDALFDDREAQTKTMSERAANISSLAGLSAVFDAVNIVSVVILVIMMLILGNTIAMGARERTTEYAVLRALGFQSSHIRKLIVGEALAVAALAGVIGVALAFPIVEWGMGRWLEENMGKFFPAFRVTPVTSMTALGATVLLGGLASFAPAVSAGRMKVVEALRHVA